MAGDALFYDSGFVSVSMSSAAGPSYGKKMVEIGYSKSFTDGHVCAATEYWNGTQHLSLEAVSAAAITFNAWHTIVGVFTASARTLYLDGVAVASSGSLPLGYTNASVIIGNANASVFNTNIAEVGVWDIAMTAAEVAVLTAGYSPLAVRPDRLRRYYPLVGQATEIDPVGGASLTTVGSPTIITHPRIVLPYGTPRMSKGGVIVPPYYGMMI
jgi:hypothetical protein